VLSVSSRAQSKGTITFGAGFLSSSVNSFDDKPVYEQSVQTRIGYFPANNFALGLCMENGISGNQSVPYGFTAFGRLYAGKKTHQVVKFYVEAGAGVAHNAHMIAGEVVRPDKNWMRGTVYVSPGINLFLVKVVSLELAPEYRYIGGKDAVNRLGASAGLKFFLTGETFKKLFPNKFVKSF